jgi:hypothetical protein
MKRFLSMMVVFGGCAQLQAQRGPSWLQAEQGWTSDRIVCLGHSGADGGVRAADWAAARCTAGVANAWLNPIIATKITNQAKAKRTFIVLARLAKVTDRYTDPATGEVVSRMELTAEEVDRQLQRELMDEQEVLASLQVQIAQGAKGVKGDPMDPPWLKDQWAKLEPQAELSERVRQDLEAQEAAQAEAKKSDQEAAAKGEDEALASPAQPAPAAPSADPAAKPPAQSKVDPAKPSPAASPAGKAAPETSKTKKVNKGEASKSKTSTKAKSPKDSKEDAKSPKAAPKASSKKD